MNILPLSFYTRTYVVKIARELLGLYLFTHIDGHLTGGIITETEAYCGLTDAACHAFANKRTPRTEIMFAEGGCAYVYRCYGLHNLFNVVTNCKGLADAVLIRAIEPQEGIDIMLARRKMSHLQPRVSSGPACVTQALGITLAINGKNLMNPTEQVWIEQHSTFLSPTQIGCSTRIGIDGAGEHARKLPWRFFIKNSTWISKPLHKIC